MYIKEIQIKGFRNFKEAVVPFHEGVNVIIGHNNTGKSNLLKAMYLVLGNYDGRSMKTRDLFYETDIDVLKHQSPRIQISLVFHRSEGEVDNSKELSLFSRMMTDENLSQEAQIRYEFRLVDTEEENYLNDVSAAATVSEIWKIIERDYIRRYKTSRFGGNAPNGINPGDVLTQIDFQFLDAIRDVSRDLYAGYNPLLHDVLNFFIDYGIKSAPDKDEEAIKRELKAKQDAFVLQAIPLMQTLIGRLEEGKNVFLKYAVDTGATFNGAIPDFNGEVTEYDLFSALRMVIKYVVGIEIPATYNGLGYNNLIYMSLLLAKMQADSNVIFMKRNTKVLSFLAVEECEAHLHPAMQYKFLEFLQDNNANGHVKQVFITSHSTQIASAIKVDDLICLTTPEIGKVAVGYPRRVFMNTAEDMKSKLFVQRFLDATKADMFFANKLIFVEGIAEELLLPVFAKYINKNLTTEHVLVINMGGRYFNHFLKLFDTTNPSAIYKKVVCLTDVDPCCKLNEQDAEYEACYPYEYGIIAGADYKHHADEEIAMYATHPNIRFFRQDTTYGKTFEYDLMRCNPDCELLLTDSVSNQKELRAMMDETDIATMMSKMRQSNENNRIMNGINNSDWDEDEKRKALLASRYLNSVKKGCNALELNVALESNLLRDEAQRISFNVPDYIVNALTWLLS